MIRNCESLSNKGNDKLGGKISLGNKLYGSLANKYKNLHKTSVNSIQSYNSRFNMANAMNGNNQRPQNNPFHDTQSFSSNGAGQVVGVSFKHIDQKNHNLNQSP